MNKLSIRKLTVVLFTFVVFAFASCATTVDVKLTRPAQVDLNGAKTIAILPFKSSSYYKEHKLSTAEKIFSNLHDWINDVSDTDEGLVINALKGKLESFLSDSPYMKLISSDAVERAFRKGYINPADIYLAGEFIKFEVEDDYDEEKVLLKKAEGNRKAEYTYVKKWKRKVSYVFRYQVIDSSNEQILYTNELRNSRSSSKYDSKKALPSVYSLVESDIQSHAMTIYCEIHPYTVSKKIELLETKTKDKALKKRFKDAEALVEDKKLKEGIAAFGQIYKETSLTEAGYNEAILQEALGNLSVAERLMEDLYNKTGDSRVAWGLNDIRYEIKQANRLTEQTKKSENNNDSDLDF